MTPTGRDRSSRNRQREALTAGWEFCGVTPGAYATPPDIQRASLPWQAAVVPGTVAGALRELKQWSLDAPPQDFDAQEWWYRLRFNASPPAAHETLTLCFEGLATIADVWLNGELLLHSENMFRAHQVDITALLRVRHDGNNELLIRFHALNHWLAVKRPRPRWKVPMLVNQQLRWARTTLLGRTPGWSPPAAAVGPWREVRLERRAHWQLDEVNLHTALHDGRGALSFSAGLQLLDPQRRLTSGELQARRGAQIHRTPVRWNEAQHRLEAQLDIASPELWWPHSHGEPALYTVMLELQFADQQDAVQVELGRTGFRQIEVDTTDGDFEIRVNGVRVFCRGACWTPLDVVTLRHATAELEQAFEQLCDAGMNMLRVGGTMVYESDAFLDACDTHGVLLWQDLMFANMDYPDSDETFLASVGAELQQQLARLRGRPSVAVICGNSEGEQQAAMFGATRDRWQPKLFHEIVPTWIEQHCPGVFYWPSSAHGGSFPHQNNAGTTSYYGVGAYLRPLDDARRSEVRFATECLAFANVPEDTTLQHLPNGGAIKVHHPQWKARVPRDLGAGWDFDDVRDHYLAQLFGASPLQLRYAEHDRYLELSRIVCGEIMAATFSEWRRKRSNCKGALIWFLRDFWPGAGWGVIDSRGVPKSAYYYLRRTLQPQAISLSDEGCNGMYLHAVNDRSTSLAAKITISLFRHGETLVSTCSRTYTLAAHGALQAPLIDWFDGFMDLSHAYRFGPPSHDLIVAALLDSQERTLAQTFWFNHSPAVEAELGLTATAQLLANGDAELMVQSRRFARAVTIQCDGFTPLDQYFHVAPGGSHRVLLKRTGNNSSVSGTVRACNAARTINIGMAA